MHITVDGVKKKVKNKEKVDVDVIFPINKKGFKRKKKILQSAIDYFALESPTQKEKIDKKIKSTQGKIHLKALDSKKFKFSDPFL